MTEFKVGDLVRIRNDLSYEEINNYNAPSFVSDMNRFRGTIGKIRSIVNSRVRFEKIPYAWHISWLAKPCRLNRKGR